MKNSDNFGTNVIDIRQILIEKFNLDPNIYKVKSIYNALKRLNMVFKKIVWKKPKDNDLSTKNKRHIIVQDLLKYHLTDCQLIYLDESSFNLNIRPCYFWGPRGSIIHGVRPVKSTNYSLLAAMDIHGIIGWILFRGGVKKEDFFYFLMD